LNLYRIGGCYLVLYGLFSNKISILYILIFFLFATIDFDKDHYVFSVMLILSLTMFLITFGYNILDNGIIELLGSLVLMRTISMPGFLTVQYMRFAESNPLTYYSHVNVIDAIFNNYPYRNVLGYEVGYFFSNSYNNNANANFIATDGVVALGPGGIIVAFLMFSILMIVVDSVTTGYSKKFLCLSSLYIIINLLNASLFTTFLSGGLLLYLVAFLFFRLDLREYTAQRRGAVQGDWAASSRE